MDKKNLAYWTLSILFIFASLGVIVCLLNISSIVIKLHPEYSYAFANEASGVKDQGLSILYAAFTIPILLIYYVIFGIFVRKMKLRFIVFPIICFIQLVWIFLFRSLGTGGAYGWMLFVYIPVLLFGVMCTFIAGLLLDIFRYLKYKKIKL